MQITLSSTFPFIFKYSITLRQINKIIKDMNLSKIYFYSFNVLLLSLSRRISSKILYNEQYGNCRYDLNQKWVIKTVIFIKLQDTKRDK